MTIQPGHSVAPTPKLDRRERPRYQTPQIASYPHQELLEMMGPAQAARSFCDTTNGNSLVDCDY